MTGTSADGVDCALLRLSGEVSAPEWELLAHRHDPFPPALRERVQAATGPRAGLRRTARLHVALAEVCARSLAALFEQAGTARESIAAVGLHGQTVFHDPGGPDPVSLQIGSATVVAERLGVPVVHDFRSRDVAAGGQGAPLVPFADAVLLRRPDRERITQNLGGIGNLTWLPAGRGLEGVSGFDTGPGNLVLDGLVRRGTGGRLACDQDGRLAASGRVVDTLLEEWLGHPFLARRPPRSAGREQWGEAFTAGVWEQWGERRPLADLLATAAAFTVECIARSVADFLPAAAGLREVILSGGGARNPVLREGIAARLAPARTLLSNELGLPLEAKEAVAFAVLADAHLQGVPAGLPAVTGARHPTVLGSLVPGAPGRAGADRGARWEP
jgi:anhydro-N-acetylmuramic acid kinase